MMKGRERSREEREISVCCVCEKGFCRSKKTNPLQTADIWSTSSSADACRCGPQTADLFPQKKQTTPYSSWVVG
ncbi:hypothetical protein Hanom_Chr01g00055201 [Helianthus anomalus]